MVTKSIYSNITFSDFVMVNLSQSTDKDVEINFFFNEINFGYFNVSGVARSRKVGANFLFRKVKSKNKKSLSSVSAWCVRAYSKRFYRPGGTLSVWCTLLNCCVHVTVYLWKGCGGSSPRKLLQYIKCNIMHNLIAIKFWKLHIHDITLKNYAMLVNLLNLLSRKEKTM